MASLTDKITDTRKAARPNSARVSSGRSPGGVSLACDNLAGWPTASKVHFVTYTIDSNSEPVEGTQLDCEGIVSGNSIGSFTIIDGTDAGNAVNDVVEMLPTAAWGQDLADALSEEHTRTGGHKNITTDTITVSSATNLPAGDIGTADIAALAVTTAKIATDAVDSTKVATGIFVQGVSTNYNAVATGTGVIPYDDTIPQITEGDEYMTQAITPKSATNILVIEVEAHLSSSAAGGFVCLALYQDSTANALAAAADYDATTNSVLTIPLKFRVVAGTTSSTTFRVRAGGGGASTTTFNGSGGNRRFGGISVSSISIYEYKV